MDQDHYATLEVSKTASSEEIKTSFRRLAKKWHPDRNRKNREEAAKKFRQVSEAYDVLSRPDRRERYDQVRGLLGAGTGGGLQGLMQAVGQLSGLMDLLTNLGGNSRPTVVMDGQQIKSPEELMAAMARMVNQHEQQTARTRSSTPPKETPKVNGQESEREKLKAKRRDKKRTPEPSRPSQETIPLHWAPPTGDPVTIASITRIEVIPAEGGDGSVGRQAAAAREAALQAAAEPGATPGDASHGGSDGQDEAAQRAATLREKAAAAAEARMRSSAPPQPASSADKPASAADKPPSAGDKPTSAADKPPSAGDKPASAADKPPSSGDKPASAADKPAEPKPATGRDARGRTDRGRLNEGTAWRREVPSSDASPSTGNEPSSSGTVPSTSTSPGSVPSTGGAAEDRRPAAASRPARQSPLTRALRCAMTAALERRPPLAHLVVADVELGADIGRALANAAAADAGIGTPPQERRVSFGFSMDVNHYEILGVDRTATKDEIKTAFRRLAKQWHPDKNKTDPEASRKFQAISDSYNVLSDEQKRSLYDALSPLRSE